LPSSHPINARIVSGRDVSSLTAPVARSSQMLAPHARHRQLAEADRPLGPLVPVVG
jgi:hypothetical protein